MKAQYNASQLITKREEVSRRIRNMLAQRAAEFRILLDDVSIVCAYPPSVFVCFASSKLTMLS